MEVVCKQGVEENNLSSGTGRIFTRNAPDKKPAATPNSGVIDFATVTRIWLDEACSDAQQVCA